MGGNRSRCLGAAASAVWMLLIGGCGAQRGGPPGGFTPQVTVVTLKTQPVTLTRDLPGRTSAYLVAEVRPQVNGIIKQRLFVEGAFVKAGQPLYQLDDAIYRAAANNARAALQKAQATLRAAELNAKRSAELVKIDAVSAQDNEAAAATFGQAQADVASAQANLDSSEVNLNYARIVSPISGRIGKSMVTQGALATANQATALATVQQLDPIYVDVNQASSEWLQLKQEIDSGQVQSGGAGTTAKIVLENGSVYAHDGKLQFTDVTVDPSTGDFLLRVLVPNPNLVLMPGMYVRAQIIEGVLTRGLVAPQEGITRDPKGDASALVVDGAGKVQSRAVKVSRSIGDQWLVDDGLVAGDRVIVEGVQKVMPGMTVQAVESPPNAAGPGARAAAAASNGH